MNLLNRNLLWLLGLTALAAVIYYFSDIVAYILIAWVLSMLGRPLVVFYRKRLMLGRFRMGPTTAAILTILTFYAAIIGILLLFIPTLVAQGRHLSEVDYQALGDKLRPMFFNLDMKMHEVGILAESESLATKTQELLSVWFKPTLLGDVLGQFLGVAGNVLVAFASITFILFFFLQDNRLFTDIIHAVVPDEQEEKVQIAVQESSEVLTRYFQGLLIQVLIFAFLATVLLWMLGVDNALLIGSFGGTFNVIPYVGPILGMVFGGFITLSSSLSSDITLILPLLAKVAIVFMVVQAIDNNFVGPLIMSKSVQAHPLEIFIVTLAAAKIGGVVGMVIGIPVYTVLRVVARNFFSHFKIVQRLTEHLDETTTESSKNKL
jgi:predicted PurR-regulated permease PerM